MRTEQLSEIRGSIVRSAPAVPATSHPAQAVTSKSEYEAGVTRNWFAREPTIVYSGAPENTLEPVAPDTTAPMILLVGGTYDAGVSSTR